jgi:3-hydroxyisobutyrate dehydrogenase-like beta-hydroxyacid dehydrogenase
MSDPGFSSVGFIGLGVMGEAMCRNLISAGRWSVTIFDLNPAPMARLEAAGAARAASAADLVGRVDLVITCLPGGAEVRRLLLGNRGLLQHCRAGQILIDMSTSPPALMREIADAGARLGVAFADAPIARTRQAADDGTLSIMVGAAPALFQRIRPLLAAMGSDITHCGDPGAGQVVKIMNNMVLFQTVLALAEAVAIGARAGVEGRTLLETMAKGSGDSFALRNHGLKSLLPEIYPEQAFSVRYAAKDLAYALELAAETGIQAPGAATLAPLFEAAIAAGDGDRYFPVIRRLLGEEDSEGES